MSFSPIAIKDRRMTDRRQGLRVIELLTGIRLSAWDDEPVRSLLES
jgi:hypothetical protein